MILQDGQGRLKEATVPAGAYGLRLDGITSAALVAPAPRSWPVVRLERRDFGDVAPEHTRIGADVSELAFLTGWSARLDRSRRSVTFFFPTPVADDELVHP